MTSKEETYVLAEELFIRAWANDPKAEPYTLAQRSVGAAVEFDRYVLDHKTDNGKPPKAAKPAKEKRSAARRPGSAR